MVPAPRKQGGSGCDAERVAPADDGDRAAVPGIAPDEEPIESEPIESELLECDGEVFALRPDELRGTHYTWVSGPNPGYGFSMSPTQDDVDQHRAHIRGFLAMIDPATGYIAED